MHASPAPSPTVRHRAAAETVAPASERPEPSLPPGVEELSYWLPRHEVCVGFAQRGVQRLFEWQARGLLAATQANVPNFVYTAPTSAGKSLVAEILMLRCVFLFILLSVQ